MKVCKLILILITFCLLGTGSIFAQDSEAFVNQVENPGIEHNSAVKEFSLKYAFGLLNALNESDIDFNPNNRAIINQEGSGNEAILEQYGSGNTNLINMIGNNNYAKSTQQGSSLLSVINMEGNNNALEFTQQGQNRGALFLFEGNDIKYNASQSGNSFSLMPQNSTTPAFNIRSNRRNLPVIIRNN